MKVQHLSTVSHNRDIRDTKDIAPITQKHFEFLGIKKGKLLKDIPKTPLTCRVTTEGTGIAMFDLMLGETLLYVNVCCFDKDKKEEAMTYVDSMVSKMPRKSETLDPETDTFIYSIEVMPMAPPQVLMLCGEIELYIFYELYKAWKN